MMMLGVVPGEEPLTETSGGLDATKTIWELRPVLERFEVGLGERIVVGGVRLAVGFADAQVGQ